MRETEAARADVAFVLPTEQRYPLRLAPAVGDLARIYREGLRDPWDPEDLVDVAALRSLGTGGGRSRQRADAGALAWSFAAWVEFAGITETDTILVRLCLESDREAEAKYLLTSRAQARALAAECCWLVASGFGAYREAPASVPLAGVLRRRVGRRMLHASVPADAIVFGHLLLAQAAETAWWEAAEAQVDGAGDHGRAVGVVIARLVRDKQRLLEFGRVYAERRAGLLRADEREAVAEAVGELAAEERRGLRCPSLLSALDGADVEAAEIAAASDDAAQSGWGPAPTAAAAAAVISHAIDAVTDELRRLGIPVPPSHQE
jgi:hypothetical protein